METLLKELPPNEQQFVLQSVSGLEQKKSPTVAAERMRKMRERAMEVTVRTCANLDRRTKALDDPHRFIKTYFSDRFFMQNAPHHHEMISAITHVARFGGDQAISAPRGEGKTTIATVMMIYAILKQWVRFPVIIAQTGPHAERIFKDINKSLSAFE